MHAPQTPRIVGNQRPATNMGRLSPVRPMSAIAATSRDQAIPQTVAGWRVRDTARRVLAYLARADFASEPVADGRQA